MLKFRQQIDLSKGTQSLSEKRKTEMESKENQKSDEAATAQKTKVAPTTKTASSDEDFSSELNAPKWSVVSFETCLASSLTYDGAMKKMKQLKAKKISGLCIITDEAAKRITN
jgi:hypothetical protein